MQSMPAEATPLISIMMPCFNNADYLGQAIESVLNQDVQARIELVIVDDCSTDNSVELIRAIGDNRIRLLQNESNQGISWVRNRLLREARGDWLTSLDGDDYYFDDKKLSRELAAVMQSADPTRTIAYSDIQLVDSQGTEIGMASQMSMPDQGIIFQGMFDRRIMIPRDFLTPAKLAVSVGGFDESLSIYEDWDYKLRLAQRAQFVFTGAAGICYRRHGGGLSAVRGRIHREHIAKIRQKHGVAGMGGDPMQMIRAASRMSRITRRKAA